jgi:hypothetical protein
MATMLPSIVFYGSRRQPLKSQIYDIRVTGHMGCSTSKLFNGFRVEHVVGGGNTCPQTVLTGFVEDQAALHGVLMRIRDLGLTLVSVNPLDP